MIKNIKRGKAAGEDRIPNECLAIIEEEKGEESLGIYNKCNEEGVFPAQWGRAKLVWLSKENKSMRPISFLPALGKILDKLINDRIGYEMEQNAIWIPERGSTIDAVENLIKEVKIAKEAGEQPLVLSLDLENTFSKAENNTTFGWTQQDQIRNGHR